MNLQPEFLAQPCRNFQFMAAERITDPKDSIEKVVFSNYVCGATGNVILLDPVTDQAESIPIPADEGGWALFNLDNEKLLVGTCGHFGYAHCLDLKTRAWAEPLRDPGENYIWNFCRGSDGMIYGGTFPGCVLLRYDPRRHTLENLGRVSDDPANLYSRYVHGGIEGHILVECMTASPHLSLWNIATRQWRRFGKPGAKVREITADFVCTQTDGALDFYHPGTFEPLPGDFSARLTPAPAIPFRNAFCFKPLTDGSIAGVFGQRYFHLRRKDETPELKSFSVPAPPTRIHTLIADERGKLWGASSFGQTLFTFDPATGAMWNSQAVCDRAGEVYGMAFARRKLFLSSYSGGDHVVYDPAQPWNQLANVNPRTLQPVGPALIRPLARSVIGPDGNFWTGWSAKYGTYGGGLSRVNVETYEVSSWYDPVGSQTIGGLTADQRHLYFITTGEANGLAYGPGPFHFTVWHPGGKIVRDFTLGPDEQPNVLASVGNRVVVAFQQPTELRMFNPDTMEFEATIPIPDAPCGIVAWGDARAVVFTKSQMLALSVRTKTLSVACGIPDNFGSATVTPGGDVYFSAGSDLFRVRG